MSWGDYGKGGGSAPTGGYYAEGGYLYVYNATSKAIAIIKTPAGFLPAAQSVPAGSTAYAAVYAQITGASIKKAVPVSAAAVKQMRATLAAKAPAASPAAPRAGAPRTPSGFQPSTPADAALVAAGGPPAAPGAIVPFAQRPWFWPVVIGGGFLTLAGFAVLLSAGRRSASASAA